ncbi:MAG: efflux RND transporter periplasmic adaptor subunit [Acidobacteria bacterium]|nr:efflux RND transporter periplasmic adaptor subunit [Acidobacteriota bacterium]
MKKFLIILVIVLVLAGGALWFFKFKDRGTEGVEVEVAPVATMTIVEKVDATGRIQPKMQVNISADVSAKITRLEVDEGDWVEKADLLLQLDRKSYLANVESSQAALRSQLANADVAAENRNKAIKDFERARALFDQKLETQAQLDAAYAAAEAQKAQHEAALNRVAQAKAVLKQAQDEMSKTTIYAPMSGTISQLNKELGEIALGSQFQEDVILVISNLSGMEALVDVDENDIVSVAIGDLASIEVDALPDVILEGVVTEIANTAKISAQSSADQKTEFQVKIAITEPNDDLRPGMTASAEIVTETLESVLAIPIQSVAVRTPEQLETKESEEAEEADGADGDKPADSRAEFEPDKDGFVEIVWLVENGKAVARQIETGIQGETHIEVRGGLAEGDRVVIGNFRAISRDLENGSAVVIKSGDDDESSDAG